LVHKKFSLYKGYLTLAGMGQELKATILAIITPSWMRVSTRTSLNFGQPLVRGVSQE